MSGKFKFDKSVVFATGRLAHSTIFKSDIRSHGVKAVLICGGASSLSTASNAPIDGSEELMLELEGHVSLRMSTAHTRSLERAAHMAAMMTTATAHDKPSPQA